VNRPIYLLVVMAVLLAACTTTAPPTATSFPPTLATTTPSLVSTSTPEAESTQPADVIFYNGVILTMEASQPLAQAIAIDGERILAVGPNNEILALKDFSTQVIDLQGKTIMPGFIDSHTHRLTQRYKWGFSSLQDAVAEALSQGWTGLDELAINQNQLEELIALDAAGDLHSRVNVYLMVNTFEGASLGDWFRAYQPGQQISQFLRIAGLKIFIDYDSGRKLFFQQAELNELVRQLQTEGWTIAVKAISIQSHEMALNAFEYALNGESNALHRHRIEHSIAASDEQVDRMARLGIIVCIQPSLPGVISFDPDTFRMRDENGENNVYRWSDYQEAGVFLIASPLNPFYDVQEQLSPTHISPMGLIYRSITQIGVGGQAPPGWMLEKALTMEQILPLLTINGAYATFEEDGKGSLTAGKYADLVILSGNPLDATVDGLLNIQPRITMVGGIVEFCAAGQEALCPDIQAAALVPSPSTEPSLVMPFAGSWEGTDPSDGSMIALSLVQTENGLTGLYKDSFSPNVNPPGYEGSGSGTVLSTTTAQIIFNLTRWDGKSAQAQYSLTLSNQNNALSLGCEVGCPIFLQREP